MATWSDTEVINLIELWGDEGIQQQLEGAKRNKHVYDKLAKELQKKGIDKTAEQCRAKMKKLKVDYRKVKDKHNKTGESRSNWKFFDTMDAVLGHRPTTRPPVVLDTSEQPDDYDEVGSEEDGEEDKVCTEQSDLHLEDAGSSHALAPSSSSSIKDAQPSTMKGKKRKRTKDEKIEAIMTSVVKEVVNSQRESDKLFFEVEEKRMKYEAEQRKEERDFQLRMMSMLFGNQSSRVTPEQYGRYHPFSSFPNSYEDM